jgi:hypothetical protein
VPSCAPLKSWTIDTAQTIKEFKLKMPMGHMSLKNQCDVSGIDQAQQARRRTAARTNAGATLLAEGSLFTLDGTQSINHHYKACACCKGVNGTLKCVCKQPARLPLRAPARS